MVCHVPVSCFRRVCVCMCVRVCVCVYVLQARNIYYEIELMRGLQHHNIVQLLGVDERKRHRLSILLEYVSGKSLDTLLLQFGAFNEQVIR